MTTSAQPIDNSIYWNISALLSERCVFNFVIGNRGGGKTFGSKRLVINRFKRKKQQFVWVRRYQTEIDTLFDFWADMRKHFPDDELTQVGKELYINGELAGYLVALSTSMQLKSVAFPNVTTIIFDEFIIDKGRITYLKNEAHVFMELFETVARLRDNVTAIFLGNAISIVNPYFTHFKIVPDLRKKFTKKGGVCVELYFNDDFIAVKEQTRFGKLIKNTSYGEYNMRNKFLRDSDSFISDRPARANDKVYQFVFDREHFSVWCDRAYQCYYVDRTFEKNFGRWRTFVSDPKDMQDNDASMILFKKSSPVMKYLIELIERGDLYFCDQSAKQKFYDKLLTIA